MESAFQPLVPRRLHHCRAGRRPLHRRPVPVCWAHKGRLGDTVPGHPRPGDQRGSHFLCRPGAHGGVRTICCGRAHFMLVPAALHTVMLSHCDPTVPVTFIANGAATIGEHRWGQLAELRRRSPARRDGATELRSPRAAYMRCAPAARTGRSCSPCPPSRTGLSRCLCSAVCYLPLPPSCSPSSALVCS